jgi:hypothetical protein
MTQTSESKSLFDFLGKPAGKELGLKVFKSATEDGVIIGKRTVSHCKHVIRTYPKSWLQRYFWQENSNENFPY